MEMNESRLRRKNDRGSNECPEARERRTLKLRRSAERVMQEKMDHAQRDDDRISDGEARFRMHELQVHQMELEMQNEELRRAYRELDTLKARYFDLYELAPIGYMTLSQKGIILESNITAANLLGFPRNSLINQHLSRFIAPEDQDIYYLNQKRLLETREPQKFELRMRKEDGDRIWALLKTTIFECNQELVCRTIISDISERRKAEDSLEIQKRSLIEILNGIDANVYVADIETYEIIFINSYGRKAFGDIEGKFCWQVFQENKTGPCDFCNNAKLIGADGKPTEGIVWEFKNTQNDRWYECRDKAINWPDGRIVRFEIANDITERKRIEADSAKNLDKKWKVRKAGSLSRMAGAIAHQFNNKLGVVIGNIEMTLEELPKDTHLLKNLSDALEAAKKTAEISHLMLTYLGQTKGEYLVANLAKMCDEILLLIKTTKMPRDISLDVVLPKNPSPLIKANKEFLFQAMNNLITNACEAIGKNKGVIRVVAMDIPKSDLPKEHFFPVDWQPQDNASYICIEVSDDGCGIKTEDIEHLFDPFFTTNFIGRGLGLPATLGIIRAHDGAIAVSSEPGKGSSFKIFLPKIEANTLPPQVEIELQKAENCGMILLVDDEEMLRKTARAMLERIGHETLEATDGTEAIEIFRQHPDRIACVLCDLTMPRMNGWEVLKELRKLSLNVPFILCSGYGKAHIMNGNHPALPQVFLEKPFTLQDLKEALTNALAKT